MGCRKPLFWRGQSEFTVTSPQFNKKKTGQILGYLSFVVNI